MAIIRKPLLPMHGVYDGVLFYRLPCGMICRELKPHTRKRILKGPEFAAFRKCSKLMAKASKIGSAVYKSLPEDFRQFWMYRAFVGEALKMLKDKGMTGEQVLESLFRTYVEVWHIKEKAGKAAKKEPGRNKGSIRHRNVVKINIRRKEYNAPAGSGNDNLVTIARVFTESPGNFISRTPRAGPPLIY